MKRGILLAAFGSGSLQGESTLRLFENLVRRRFPGTPVRWAFTSAVMRCRLAGARKKTDSVDKALHKMAFEKFSHVAVQPLHVIPGREYREVLEQIREVLADRRGLEIGIGAPLLHETADMAAVRGALFQAVPVERQAEEAVLFIGHGSPLTSDDRYAVLARAVQADDPRLFLGTLSGGLGVEEVLPCLTSLGVRRIWLVPLLAVVGRHTLEDMAGEGEGSWKTRLERAGFSCRPVLRGMVESPGFAQLWLDRLEEACRTVFCCSPVCRQEE